MWVDDFDKMGLKTATKLLLSRYGILSIEMHKAIQADQAEVVQEGSFEYVDNMKEIPGARFEDVSKNQENNSQPEKKDNEQNELYPTFNEQ